MTRSHNLVVAILFFTIAASAQKDLKSRADAATGGEKAKLAVEYTDQATKDADKAFNQGKDEEGFAELQDVAQYAKIAADAAMQSGKRQKDTEISLRKIAKHLDDIKKARPYEQQQTVQDAIQAVLAAHDNLLNSMFQKNH
jgi:hypothetical protein